MIHYPDLCAFNPLVMASGLVAKVDTAHHNTSITIPTQAIDKIDKEASFLIDLSLKLLAGTVAGIVTAKFDLQTPRSKLIFLLFIPAWICLLLPIFFGNAIHEQSIVLALYPRADIFAALTKMGQFYKVQFYSITAALFILAVWLIWFLILWIKK